MQNGDDLWVFYWRIIIKRIRENKYYVENWGWRKFWILFKMHMYYFALERDACPQRPFFCKLLLGEKGAEIQNFLQIEKETKMRFCEDFAVSDCDVIHVSILCVRWSPLFTSVFLHTARHKWTYFCTSLVYGQFLLPFLSSYHGKATTALYFGRIRTRLRVFFGSMKSYPDNLLLV